MSHLSCCSALCRVLARVPDYQRGAGACTELQKLQIEGMQEVLSHAHVLQHAFLAKNES